MSDVALANPTYENRQFVGWISRSDIHHFLRKLIYRIG